MAYTQVQYGSKGSAVKELQELLNNNGYSLTADGIFGSKTQAAVKDYQLKNGLTVDGIAGLNTFTKLNSNKNTATNTMPTKPTLTNTNFNDTTDGATKKGAMDDALAKFNQYGENWKYKDQYSTLFEDYIGRDPFSYDLNGDALYQQYKDKYIQQGKLAMQDTMGQASAMTGGYGSSYAQSVGQQAYQNSLDNLNDIVPELYQMAYDKYNQEGSDMLNKLGIMDADYERGYNEAKDRYSTANSDYYSAADLYGSEQDRANGISQQDWQNAMTIYNTNEDARRWEKEFGLQERQVALQEKSASAKVNNVNNTTQEEEDPNDKPFKAVDTPAVQSFKASIKTKNEFYTRGGKDKETYKTYEAYIEGIIDKWIDENRFTTDVDNEVATLLDYYGLLD